MNARPQDIPVAVREAIVRKFAPDIELAEQVMACLNWDSINGNYYFTYANMYHGIETDGYIHT